MTVRVEVKPAHAVGTIRVDETLDPETIIRMSAKDLDTFSTVPLSIAAAASLLQFENYQPALQRLLRLQPQNAGRFFAREKGKETIAESNEANADMALQLMSAWAGDIADAARHSGVEREARLNGGAEVFAAYLQKIEFAHHINHQEVKELEIIFLDAAQKHTMDQWMQAAFANPPLPDTLPDTLEERLEEAKVARKEGRERAQRALRPMEEKSSFQHFQGFRDLIFDLMEEGQTSCEYASSIIGMICAGAAIYSREQANKDKARASKVSTALGLAGAVVGFFPAAAPAVGLTTVLGTNLVQAVAGAHVRRHAHIENIVRRYANAMMLDRGRGVASFGYIVLAALDGMEGRP
ncbi:hypothetical protein EHS25_003949 [Saitozyma podzolica]|uniref:Uncharacterized protein n=1 Tax=Saitozyma podzolica TaxID=1890683 RepID=A0A427YSY9_9TREE|nr:hypothetical protein EHS25_003949 [Saitozyma podzolica]